MAQPSYQLFSPTRGRPSPPQCPYLFQKNRRFQLCRTPHLKPALRIPSTAIKRILKTNIVNLTPNKPAELRKLRMCLCSHKSTIAGVELRLSFVADAGDKFIHTLHRLLPQSQQQPFSRTFSQYTKQSLLWSYSQNIVHRVWQLEIVSTNFRVASVLCLTEQLSLRCIQPPKKIRHLYHTSLRSTRRNCYSMIVPNCTNIAQCRVLYLKYQLQLYRLVLLAPRSALMRIFLGRFSRFSMF